jgi:carbon storage regulator
MLVLSRKRNQSLTIDGRITVTVLASDKRTVRIGIVAPKEVPIVRSELSSTTTAPPIASVRQRLMSVAT